MTRYEQVLSLTIRHSLIDVSRWSLLPSGETERYLARNRLRMSFTLGWLAVTGVSDEGAERCESETESGELCLYLEKNLTWNGVSPPGMFSRRI